MTLGRDVGMFDPNVHQAEGALCAEFGVSIDEAVLILRARAASAGLPLEYMADEVLAGMSR